MDPVHWFLSVPVKDDGVHGIVGPHAQLVRADLRISDIVEIPGENVALHVPCEQSVPIDRHASDLLFVVEASQALACFQIPQLNKPVQSVAYFDPNLCGFVPRARYDEVLMEFDATNLGTCSTWKMLFLWSTLHETLKNSKAKEIRKQKLP